MQDDSSDPAFTRRKFSLPESLNNDLERIAAQHYQGNVSLCLRQAIEDHRATLQGEGRTTLKQILAELSDLRGAVNETINATEEIASQLETVTTQQDPINGLQPEPQTPQNIRPVMQALHDADTPLRATDLVEQLSLPPQTIRSALGFLIDTGTISTTDTTPPRYHPVTMRPAADHHPEHP